MDIKLTIDNNGNSEIIAVHASAAPFVSIFSNVSFMKPTIPSVNSLREFFDKSPSNSYSSNTAPFPVSLK